MKNKVLRTGLVSGPIAAIVCTLFLIALHIFGVNPFGKRSYMLIGIYALPFVASLWFFRDKLNNYRISPFQGIGLGMVLNLIAVLLFGIITYYYFENMDASHEALQLHKKELHELLVSSKEDFLTKHSEAYYKETQNNINLVTVGGLVVDLMKFLIFVGVIHTFFFMLIFKN